MELGLIIVLIVCFLIMAAGLISIIFPYLPSIPLIWLGIFLYAIASKFDLIDERFIITVTVMTLAVILLDYVTMVWGIGKFRVSFWGIVGAVMGGIIGSFFNIFLALIVGPLIGGIIGEVLAGQDLAFALKTKKYTIIYYAAGTIIKIGVGVAMIGLFIWKLAGGGN